MGLVLAQDIGEVTGMKLARIVLILALASACSKHDSGSLAVHTEPKPPAAAKPAAERKQDPVKVSDFAKQLSPTKDPDEQNQQERMLLQKLRSRYSEIEGAYKVQLLDDDGHFQNPMQSIEKLNTAIMKDRGYFFGNNHLLPKMVTFGADAGLALYRVHKVNTQQPIIDCARRPGVLAEYDSLRQAVCKSWERSKCDALLGHIDEHIRNEYRHIAQWLPNFPIDDYGFMCTPYQTLETWAKRVIAKYPSREAQRRVFIWNTSVDMGLALYRLAQHIQANAPPAPVAQKPSKPLHQKQRLRALRAVEGDLL